MNKLEENLFKAGFALLIILFFMLPLILLPSLNDQYILPKATLLRITAFLLLFVYLLQITFAGNTSFKYRQLLPVFVLIFILGISTAYSQNFYLSFFGSYLRNEGFITYISYILIFLFSAVYINNIKKVTILFEVISLSVIIVGFLSVLEYFGIFVVRGGSAFELTRSASTIGNPVYQGIFLTTMFPLVLFLIKTGSSRQKVIGTLSLLSGATGLYLTQSRTAMALALFVIPISLYFLYSRKPDIKKVFVLFLLLASIFFAFIFSSTSSSRFSISGFAEGSLERRLNWINTLHLIKDSPFTGFGLETYELNNSKYETTSIGMGRFNDKPHNGLLELAFSLGLAGLASLIWLTGYLVMKAYYFFKISKNEQSRHLISVLIVAILTFPIIELAAFTTPVTTPYFFMAIGLLMAIKSGMTQNEWILKQAGPWLEQGSDDTAEEVQNDKTVSFLRRGTCPPLAEESTVKHKMTWAIMTIFSAFIFFGVIFWQIKAISAESYYKRALSATSPSSYWLYGKAINANPYVPQYYETYARILNKSGANYKQFTIGLLIKALKYFPKDVSLWLALGDIYYNSSDAEKALYCFSQALNIAPNDLTVNWSYADALMLNERHKEAVVTLEKILEKAPNDENINKSLKKARKGL